MSFVARASSTLRFAVTRAAFVAAAVLVVVAAVGVSTACVGSTGGGVVTFDAFAHGPKTASLTSGYAFHTSAGWDVTLRRAKMQIGAVYLNRSVPLASERETSCVLPGIYVGEITDGVMVDVLDPAGQKFPVRGEGTRDHAVTAEIWLGAGDINALNDDTVLLDVAGTARKGGAVVPFEGTITIAKNRAIPPENAALPGGNPLCEQRIISPIAVSLDLADNGTLDLAIEPRGWFDGVAFDKLTEASPGHFIFGDDSASQPDINLYMGFRGNQGAYAFAFVTE